MRQKHVIVLGCGPVGLLAAHAAEEAGHHVTIMSRKQKSIIPGAQHLHGPIPGLTPIYPERTTQYIRIGTAEGYARKVYGDPSHASGWHQYQKLYPSWNLVRVYNNLWERFEDQIVNAEVDWRLLNDLSTKKISNDLVFTTIPQWSVCHQEHSFDKVPYRIQTLPTAPNEEHTEILLYNGLTSDPWYRWSLLNGICSMEYSEDDYRRLTVEDLERGVWAQGLRAVGNNCDCWSGLHRVGRWAEWRHGVTVFLSWQRINTILKEARLA